MTLNSNNKNKLRTFERHSDENFKNIELQRKKTRTHCSLFRFFITWFARLYGKFSLCKKNSHTNSLVSLTFPYSYNFTTHAMIMRKLSKEGVPNINRNT